MLPPISVLGAAALAVALVAGCQSADATKCSSEGSSPSQRSNPPVAAAAATAPVTSGTIPNDSISTLADRGRIQGNSQATLWIIEASDFQCPYCKTWHDSTYGQVVRDYVNTGKVRLAYLNFPLSQHRNAMPAAEAAMCASVQDKFWPMHDALFTAQPQWEGLPNPMPAFEAMAARVGVAMPSWRECVAKHLTRPMIEADYARSRTAGVKSTPAFFVGDQLVAGVESYAFFRQVIEGQLGKSKRPVTRP